MQNTTSFHVKRPFKMLKDDMCTTAIGQAILELRKFKDTQGNPQASRKMSFPDFSKCKSCRKFYCSPFSYADIEQNDIFVFFSEI